MAICIRRAEKRPGGEKPRSALSRLRTFSVILTLLEVCAFSCLLHAKEHDELRVEGKEDKAGIPSPQGDEIVRIHFRPGDAHLNLDSEIVLSHALLSWIDASPPPEFLLVGRSERGESPEGEEGGRRLAKERAQAVKKALIEIGVPEARIQIGISEGEKPRAFEKEKGAEEGRYRSVSVYRLETRSGMGNDHKTQAGKPLSPVSTKGIQEDADVLLTTIHGAPLGEVDVETVRVAVRLKDLDGPGAASSRPWPLADHLQRRLNGIESAYREALRRNQRLVGVSLLQLDMNAEGEVLRLSLQPPEEDVSLTKALETLFLGDHFPPPPARDKMSVVLELTIHATFRQVPKGLD